jgi:hypothetical protein
MRFLCSLLALSLMLTSCCYYSKSREIDTLYADVIVDFPLTETVAYVLAKIVAERKANNFNIELCHAKAYRRLDGSFLIAANFYSQEILEINEARHVVANLAADILLLLNMQPMGIRFAEDLPFTPSNLTFSIDYESFFGRFVDPRLVGRTELREGYLTAYYAHSALDADSFIFQQFFEPYITTAMLTRVDERVAEEMILDEEGKQLLDLLQGDEWKNRVLPPPPLPDRVEYEENGRTIYHPRCVPPPPKMTKRQQNRAKAENVTVQVSKQPADKTRV